MINIKKLLHSKTGMKLFSIILGLGLASLFKMSCDNRSCIVYKGPEFEDDKKTLKYNNKCYKVEETLINCKDKNGELIYL